MYNSYIGVLQLELAEFDKVLLERRHPPGFEVHQF